jgi:hypothetical protein
VVASTAVAEVSTVVVVASTAAVADTGNRQFKGSLRFGGDNQK